MFLASQLLWLFWLRSAGSDGWPCVQEIKQERDAAARQIENEAKRIADKLGLELDKSVKLEWHKSNNVSVRCMRITKTEV